MPQPVDAKTSLITWQRMLLLDLIERSMVDTARLNRAFAHNFQTQIPNLNTNCKDDLIIAPIQPAFI
jgi:hypothetical protein